MSHVAARVEIARSESCVSCAPAARPPASPSDRHPRARVRRVRVGGTASHNRPETRGEGGGGTTHLHECDAQQLLLQHARAQTHAREREHEHLARLRNLRAQGWAHAENAYLNCACAADPPALARRGARTTCVFGNRYLNSDAARAGIQIRISGEPHLKMPTGARTHFLMFATSSTNCSFFTSWITETQNQIIAFAFGRQHKRLTRQSRYSKGARAAQQQNVRMRLTKGRTLNRTSACTSAKGAPTSECQKCISKGRTHLAHGGL